MPSGPIMYDDFCEEHGPRYVDTPFKYGTIRHRNLPGETLLPFIAYTAESVEKVATYLDVPPIDDKIIQLVGRHSRSMAILDEKRIRISEHKLPNETCLLHELTHLLMGPSPLGEVFTEGLAVHVQEILSPQSDLSYPVTASSHLVAAAKQQARINLYCRSANKIDNIIHLIGLKKFLKNYKSAN